MSSPDRSWTVAPTLLWFCAFMVLGIWYVDGSTGAIADRLTHEREADAQPAGPVFTAKPVVVAEVREDDVEPVNAVPAVGGVNSDRTKGSALEDICIEGPETACKRWAMDAFYKSVRDEGAGTLGRAMRVSWYGDSVIATDAIPARLRSRLQGELGDGGPGFVYAVEPHRFCFHEGVARAHEGAWATHAVSTQPTSDQLYGAGGASAEASGGASATFKLNAGRASKIELYYLAQPKGGVATVKANGTKVLETPTAGDKKLAGGASATVEGGAQRFAIETKGRVRLFGIGLENESGAVVDNLGIVSVNVKNFAVRNEENFAQELVHRGADLVMIMIGANEAQWLGPNDTATKDYQGRYEKVLAMIRKARPDATCLVVSPTDQAEAKDGGYVSRPVMPVLVEAQRRAARASGCAFFSTYDWMGGKGSAAKWFKKGLVGSDFQHLSRKGANKFADAVFDALMAGYKRYGH
jgi:lysophospholipase L1-like esterase